MGSLINQATGNASPEQSAAARVEQLYASHSALVRSVCRSLLRDAVEAEDVAQQTFLSAQRALLSGSSPRDAAAWLATIARHESFARIRARMREPLAANTELEAAGPDAHAMAVRRHEVGELRSALQELPAQQREAILLREVRGLSYEEVASTLSVTTAAVESLLFRARRNLQEKLRNSLALFPPGGFVRELAARLGGGLTAPAAAKTLAVGVGAAVVTGSVVAGPRIVDPGNAPHARPPASAGAIHRNTHRQIAFDLPNRSSRAQLRTAAPTASRPTARRQADGHSSGGDAAPRPEGSDRTESPSPGSSDGSGDSTPTSASDNSGSNDGGGTNSGDTQTTSSGDNSTTTDSSSQTNDSQSTTQTTTTSSGSDGSGGKDGH
jgi:RNA polymerase sigma-70 factor (ECF subfamily)